METYSTTVRSSGQRADFKGLHNDARSSGYGLEQSSKISIFHLLQTEIKLQQEGEEEIKTMFTCLGFSPGLEPINNALIKLDVQSVSTFTPP